MKKKDGWMLQLLQKLTKVPPPVGSHADDPPAPTRNTENLSDSPG